MKPVDPPPVEHEFAYADPPRSGNAINGVGEASVRRPEKIAPDDFTIADYDYKALFDFFFLTMPWPAFKEFVFGMFESRNARGPVAKRRAEVDDPAAMAATVKGRAREIGFGLVGITEVDEELLLYQDDEPWPYRYCICLGTEQDRRAMEQVPQEAAGLEVTRTYRRSSRCSNELAAWIRSLGWPAEAFAVGRDILMIPSALRAGLGELGKHGSMISREFGANFRLTLVLTDLPLAVDAPVDIGVQDLCATCQACTKACPPGAISDTKSLVRGVDKWYVDYDKCAWYFAKTLGCSICVEVCPWSEPGKGGALEALMMRRRGSAESAPPD